MSEEKKEKSIEYKRPRGLDQPIIFPSYEPMFDLWPKKGIRVFCWWQGARCPTTGELKWETFCEDIHGWLDYLDGKIKQQTS